MTRRQQPYHLVQDGLSKDTKRALEQLVEDANNGDVIGLAYVAMYRQREYRAGATGECRRNPTFTRGMVRALDDVLGGMVTR